MRKKFVLLLCSVLLLGAMELLNGFAPLAHASTVEKTSVTAAVKSGEADRCSTLWQGSSGTAVRTLQSKLNSLYLRYSDPRWFGNTPDNFKPPLGVDGIFGPLTRDAVIDYQAWNGLQVDGIVGPQTWRSLRGC